MEGAEGLLKRAKCRVGSHERGLLGDLAERS